MIRLNTKGQSLPLNTIVIAILVIVVMLVIIVFFTSEVGETGDALDQNSPTECEISNPALATLYQDAERKRNPDASCDDPSNSDSGWQQAVGIADCCVLPK